ncbi:division/cell wall cluster transcriptional repressor MraZ [Aeoliella sp. ICT_H6.2]|uniref:Transcriptional regulator MraZ n=1 Tax=Aeoliella straminimaris TaxID=2954799 RepID=A0A9X2FH42_9BACT|nr:division/cell wall cluster transcriptional repressor MraZ [Aeoliella straminimaris]MCO6044446.1 division/cell wall cluster transcriptional repressor MraZ [Aeoliella straminimaris]
MLLTGTHHRSLDDKCRVALPKPLREGLETGENSNFYLAPGTDGALALYPESTFRRLGERLQAATPNARGVREYARLFFSRAAAVRPDKQGRLRIPTELAEFAKLSGEVVLVGVQDHVEIWPRASWEQYIEQRADQYDQLAESAFLPPQQEM